MIDKQGQKLEHQLRGQTPQRYEAHGGWHRGSSWGGGWQDQPEEEGWLAHPFGALTDNTSLTPRPQSPRFTKSSSNIVSDSLFLSNPELLPSSKNEALFKDSKDSVYSQ